MEAIKEFYETHKKNITLLVSFTLLMVVACFFFCKIEHKYKKEIKQDIVATVVEKNTPEELNEEITEIKQKIMVDVKGFVVNEGVYSLDENSRVIDAINIAGGLREGAYTRYLNLSKKLSDENVIIVSSFEEVDALIKENKELEKICEPINCACTNNKEIITSETTTKKNEKQENNLETNTDVELNILVNINTATKEELMTLNGVGESKADLIIEYRNGVGPFQTIEDIKNVKGIGESMYEKIKNNITV